MAVISPDKNTLNGKIRYAVYYKWNWTDAWIYAPYFEPLEASLSIAPSTSHATLRTRYGQGKWEDMEQMIDGGQVESFLYCYIQIRSQRGNNESALWTGLIQAEVLRLLGQSGNVKITDQTIQAWGLETLLDTWLDGAWVKNPGEDEPEWIDHLPIFNRRHQFGGNIIGNRSFMRETEELTYIFSSDDELWSNYDIIEYFLAHYNYENGPEFHLAANGEIKTALENITGIYDFRTTKTRIAINHLINRGRGLGWHVVITGNLVDIVPFSLLDESIKLDEVIMPANFNIVAPDLWTKKEQIKVDIKRDITHVYDRIVVQGGKMKSCCSLHFDMEGDSSHPSLEKGWSEEAETAFKNAAKTSEEYNGLSDQEKGELNDKFRKEDKFDRVFTIFRVPHDWDWSLPSSSGDIIVNPFLDPAGELDIGRQAGFWNADKKFSNSLPFQVGVDYSDKEPIDNNPDYAEPEFRTPFILVKGAEGKYQYADKRLKHYAAVRVLSREMAISMRFNPQYLAAKDHWDEAEPAVYEAKIEESGIDYEYIIATVFIETDQSIRIVHAFNYYENQKTLLITIPDAELWYIVPGTIVGVDKDGELIEYGCDDNLLRDDRSRLRAALNAAAAWYGRRHDKVEIAIKEIDPGIPVGTLITNSDVAGTEAVKSTVTSIQWDFQSKSTIIRTDYGELDISGIFAK